MSIRITNRPGQVQYWVVSISVLRYRAHSFLSDHRCVQWRPHPINFDCPTISSIPHAPGTGYPRYLVGGVLNVWRQTQSKRDKELPEHLTSVIKEVVLRMTIKISTTFTTLTLSHPLRNAKSTEDDSMIMLNCKAHKFQAKCVHSEKPFPLFSDSNALHCIFKSTKIPPNDGNVFIKPSQTLHRLRRRFAAKKRYSHRSEPLAV